MHRIRALLALTPLTVLALLLGGSTAAAAPYDVFFCKAGGVDRPDALETSTFGWTDPAAWRRSDACSSPQGYSNLASEASGNSFGTVAGDTNFSALLPLPPAPGSQA